MASPKLISTLKFLSNCKTMFWLISQEQHSIKTQEFTETNSYFYSFTYGKNIFSSSSYQWIDFLWICWQAEKLWIQHKNILCLMGIQTRLLFFSPCIREKWVNMIDWSTKLIIFYQTEPNVEKSSFFSLSSIRKNWKAQSRTTFKISVFNPCVSWVK